jgi:uncharacterized Ntn-hydrolase superfamily protein
MMKIPSLLFNTYSIVARDPETGDLGVAVQTHQMCVGAVVPWLKIGVGAIATQASTNISFGPLGLSLLEEGLNPTKVVDTLVASDEAANRRQFAIVDAEGKSAAWTGEDCIAEAGHHVGEGFTVQANMMTKDTVIEAMVSAFSQAKGDLAERMMTALIAAQAEEGDIRGMQSAALRVVKGTIEGRDAIFRRRGLYDLRVDEHDQPVEELARLVRLRRAQIINMRGHQLLEDGKIKEGMEIWAEARTLAPELEEMSFWQAVALADKPEDVASAAKILRPMLQGEKRSEQWIDLIRRIQDCGIIERSGAGDILIQVLDEGDE